MSKGRKGAGLIDGLASRLGRGTTVDRMIFVSKRYRYVYVTNQKVACSAIKLALYRAELGKPGWKPLGGTHKRRRAIVPGPTDLDPATFNAMMAGQAFRFTFVRNPFVRLLSAYRDKIEKRAIGPVRDGIEPQKNILRLLDTQLGISDPRDVLDLEFPAFVDRICALPSKDMDPHWRPQVHNVCNDVVDYDLIGRLESFEADMNLVSDATGLPLDGLERRNVTNAAAHVPLYYTPDAARQVERRYSDDFEAFGYSQTVPGS